MSTRTKRIASARTVFCSDQSEAADGQAELEQRFFSGICLPNGTHKTTAANRLREVDQAVCFHLRRGGAIQLLDVGISSGVTTLELLDRLEGLGHRVSGVGLDIRIQAYLRAWMGMDILYDVDGRVLQIATRLFAKGRPDHPLRTTRSRVLQTFMTFIERTVVAHWSKSNGLSAPIKLVSPRILTRPGFLIAERDISEPLDDWTDSFNVIRAANILNLSYFAPSTLKVMIAHLTSCLMADGLLVICRTNEDGSNHGTIFRRQGSLPTLMPISRIGVGSELEPLVQVISERPTADSLSLKCS